MQKNKYNSSPAMALLGYQILDLYEMGAHDDFHLVLNTHISCASCTYDIALDMFSLGVIYGKRADRAKRKVCKHQNQTAAGREKPVKTC